MLTQYREEYRFPVEAAQRFKQCCEDFVAVNAILRRHFETVVHNGKPVLIFHVTIKYHYLLHIADMALYINPRVGWCYRGESLMHRVRILVQASCHGVAPHNLADKVMKKYCQGLAMRLVREQSFGEW